MTKRKLERFAEIGTFSNVFQKDARMKGQWNKDYFKNNNPIVLELGCGRGEYTIEMARTFPEKNFIGIDLKGNRIWRGSKTAVEENLHNVAFLRIQIELILDYFNEHEVSEIWITFPDPQPQISREKKRLTSPRFLNYYKKILKSDGLIHLKTDNNSFFDYTLRIIEEEKLTLIRHTDNLYNSDLLNELLSIKTTYESRYLREGKNIHYLCYSI